MANFTVLHFSSTDRAGGAAACAYDIHSALTRSGMRSVMVVRHKNSTDKEVVEAQPASLPERAFFRAARKVGRVAAGSPKASYVFDFDETPPIRFESLLPLPRGKVDILFLHWSNRFLTSRWIRRLHDYYQCPIVWFLADQQAMTGGCHYTFGCERFLNSCGECPQLGGGKATDRSRKTWIRKSRALSDLPITFVCGGDWVLKQVERSSLFHDKPTVRVPGIFDQTLYRLGDKSKARETLELPLDKKIIFFGACGLDDPRKGGSAFLEAQEILYRRLLPADSPLRPSDIFLLFAGNGFDSLKATGRLKFSFRSIGLVDASKLAQAYQASDVFVCTSTADVGPGMVIESLLCGTPVAGFSVGISAEILQGGISGEVVPPGKCDSLAEAVEKILQWPDDQSRKNRVADTARGGYSEQAAVEAYQRLFGELTAGNRSFPRLGGT